MKNNVQNEVKQRMRLIMMTLKPTERTISMKKLLTIFTLLTLTTFGHAERISGDENDNVLVGTDRRDTIWGYGGNDTIYGKRGPDQLSGGDGDDYINGQRGDDWIYGGPGNDVLHGSDDSDHIYGGNGNDILYGERGNDFLYGGNGSDQLYGGRGWNVIVQNSTSTSYIEANTVDAIFKSTGTFKLSGDETITGTKITVITDQGTDIIYVKSDSNQGVSGYDFNTRETIGNGVFINKTVGEESVLNQAGDYLIKIVPLGK